MADHLCIAAPLPLSTESSLAFSNQALSTQNHKIGYCFWAPESDTITHLGFRYGARTSTPPQHTISLQGLDGSGLPDGTILGGGSPASATFTPPADTTWDGTWQWVALSNSYAVTRGQKLAIVVDCTSDPASGSSSYTRSTSAALSYLQNLPYPAVNTGSWAKSSNVYQVVYGMKSSTAVYGVPLQGSSTRTTGTTGRRVAMKFRLASAITGTFKVPWFRMLSASGNSPVGTASTFAVGLWNAAGTAQQSTTAIDSDQMKQTGGSSEFVFTGTLATLSTNTDYYIGLECESSNTIRMFTLDCANANDLLAFPMGAYCCYSLWDGSSWTDTTTARPWLEIGISDLTATCGGGGATAPLAGSGLVS